MAPIGNPTNWRATAIPFLNKTAHFSAPFITTFLLIHLSSPVMANLGGSSLASQTMLLGREYYQTALSEPLLVLGPMAVHAFSATFKRLLSPPGRPPRRVTHLLSLTGYATMLFLLPVHFLTHREYPTLEVSPIHGLGPAELDYEFVKAGLSGWPVRGWVLYGGLVLCVIVHAVDGTKIIWNTYMKEYSPSLNNWQRATRPWRMALALGIIALPILMGVYALTKEPLMSFKSITDRHHAVFLSSFVYRI